MHTPTVSKVNPTLNVHEGETVQINLINGEGAEHDIVVEQYAARSDRVVGKNASSIAVRSSPVRSASSSITARCRAIVKPGWKGRLQISPGRAPRRRQPRRDIVRDPTDLPPPLPARAPQVVRVDLETVELKGRLDDKTDLHLLDLQRQGARPVVRVRVGDTVEVHLKNHDDSAMIHSVDFHARDRPRRRRQVRPRLIPGEENGRHLQGAEPGHLRLPLRDTDGRRTTSPTACTA